MSKKINYKGKKKIWSWTKKYQYKIQLANWNRRQIVPTMGEGRGYNVIPLKRNGIPCKSF